MLSEIEKFVIENKGDIVKDYKLKVIKPEIDKRLLEGKGVTLEEFYICSFSFEECELSGIHADRWRLKDNIRIPLKKEIEKLSVIINRLS